MRATECEPPGKLPVMQIKMLFLTMRLLHDLTAPGPGLPGVAARERFPIHMLFCFTSLIALACTHFSGAICGGSLKFFLFLQISILPLSEEFESCSFGVLINIGFNATT